MTRWASAASEPRGRTFHWWGSRPVPVVVGETTWCLYFIYTNKKDAWKSEANKNANRGSDRRNSDGKERCRDDARVLTKEAKRWMNEIKSHDAGNDTQMMEWSACLFVCVCVCVCEKERDCTCLQRHTGGIWCVMLLGMFNLLKKEDSLTRCTYSNYSRSRKIHSSVNFIWI